jgi:hypothetical protein
MEATSGMPLRREANAIALVPHSQKEQLIAEWNMFTSDLNFEYQPTNRIYHSTINPLST